MKYSSLRKLSPEQVRAIRAARKPYDRSGSLRTLAKKFGVCQKVIVEVCRFHRYKEIR